MKSDKDISVFISSREARCSDCGVELRRGDWLTLGENKAVLCLGCADLEHLEFLPAGDAALTRRAKKHSGLWAVVVQWSRRRKRFERQGLLVETRALEQAEEECLADSALREARRQRNALRREILDKQYVDAFRQRIVELYPSCPEPRSVEIAEHACKKYSGRVGRTAFAKELDAKAVRLAVAAHIRHCDTDYDTLLLRGVPRSLARESVLPRVQSIVEGWSKAGKDNA